MFIKEVAIKAIIDMDDAELKDMLESLPEMDYKRLRRLIIPKRRYV
jgi:ribosomal 50S subunit-associated protein YjgA (DUF615 family)